MMKNTCMKRAANLVLAGAVAASVAFPAVAAAETIVTTETQNSALTTTSFTQLRGGRHGGRQGESAQIEAPTADETGALPTLEDYIEFVYDASDMVQTYTEDGVEKSIPDEEYQGMLRERGERTLEGKKKYIAFRSLIDTHGSHKYKVDFDLGDRVTCVRMRCCLAGRACTRRTTRPAA